MLIFTHILYLLQKYTSHVTSSAHATQGIFSKCVTIEGQSPFYGTKNLELLSLLRCTREVVDFKYCSMGGRLLHRNCWIYASGYRPWPCIGRAWVSHKMCRFAQPLFIQQDKPILINAEADIYVVVSTAQSGSVSVHFLSKLPLKILRSQSDCRMKPRGM